MREPKARHGRREVRMVWAIADPALNAYVGSAGAVGQPWPHLTKDDWPSELQIDCQHRRQQHRRRREQERNGHQRADKPPKKSG